MKEKKFSVKNLICFLFFAVIFILIFALYIRYLHRTKVPELYNLTSFLISYENGFISRGLIGTIYSLIPLENLFPVINFTTMIFLTIIFTFMGQTTIKNFQNTSKNTNLNFWYVFMMCSGASFYFVLHHYSTKFEIFWYLLFIPVFYGFQNLQKNKFLKFGMMLLFSVISVLIHQGFVFILMPFIMIMLWEEDEKKFCILYAVITGIVFLICQFLGKGDYDLIWYNVKSKMLQLPLEDMEKATYYMGKMVYLEYNLGITEHFKVLKNGFINVNLRMFFDMFLSNILNIFALIYLMVNVMGKKLKLYAPFILLTQIPLYVLTIDYDRWILLLMLNCILLINYELKKITKEEIQNINLMKASIFPTILFFANIFLLLYEFLFL